MIGIQLIYILLFLPILAAVISLSGRKNAEISNIFLSFITGIFAFLMLIGNCDFYNGFFYTDIYSAVIVNIVAWLYFFVSLASHYYLKNAVNTFFDIRYYWSFLALFTLTMIFTSVISSLGWMWIGIEGATIASALLIITVPEKKNIEGAWRYIIIASTGLALSFLSIILIYYSSGTLDITQMTITSAAAPVITSFALLGFGTKLGLFPMHTWLPDAYDSAPCPISAILSGGLFPVVLLVYIRIYSIVDKVSSAPLYLTLVFGLLTILSASILMASQKYLKRLLAYSSMDIIGIATVGVAVSYYDSMVLYLVLLTLVIHAFSKGALFTGAGNIIKSYNTEKIDKIRGIFWRDPVGGITLSLSALSVSGAPPFGIFIGEMGIAAIIIIHRPWYGIFFVFALLLSFLALNRHFTSMISGEASGKDVPLREKIVPVTMMLVSTAIGIWAWFYILDFQGVL